MGGYSMLAAPWQRCCGGQAEQQPDWEQHPELPECRAALASAPALVDEEEIARLRGVLSVAAVGGAHVLQLGDCAESFAETGERHVITKLAVLHELADGLADLEQGVVVRIGRFAGQFAKPRSQSTEQVGDGVLPVFRGHLVNSEEPRVAARRPDPHRMLRAYFASAEVLRTVRTDWVRRLDQPFADGPWSSHDALILDYETSLVRAGARAPYLASTHFPWIGDRTRHPESAHVRLLSAVGNPVACKVGPSTSPEELLRVCARLDPDRVRGRLTLIVRLGAARVAELLPPLVAAVRAAGHPALWLCDPMHGNTIRTGDGLKTRHLDAIVAEAVTFRRVLRRAGVHPGGLHLEVAALPVTECVGIDVRDHDDVPRRYTTLCDPRLNPEQTAELLRHWAQA